MWGFLSDSVPNAVLPRGISERDKLEGSSMRRIVPETQAALRGMMNSNPSPETRVTYSDCAGPEEDMGEKDWD
jgi:hypothetical protein